MTRPDIRPGIKSKIRSLWPVLARAAIVAGGVSLLLRRFQSSPTPSAPDEASQAGGAGEAGPDDTAQHGMDSGRGRRATPPSAKARREGHETEDMSGRLMTRLALGLGTAACIVVFGIIEARTWVRRSYLSEQPALTALQTAPIIPPGPHLQTHPVKDIDQLHAQEDSLLLRYAWVDPARTRARIPINRAMDLTVGRSLEHAP